MPIIFICSVPFGGGERLARSLADKLGYAYLSREDVVARANDCGIPVGKLEVAMVKKPAWRERLGRLKERYLAVATSTICEKAAAGNLVYYGRSGHFLLPGVTHVLRVRVIPEPSQRLDTVVQRTKLSRERAVGFLDEIDADIRAWVQFVHGAQMDDLHRYDFVVNLENISIENAAVALCGIADLPDFRPTPASRRAMDERLLQARARIKLALDERTADGDLTVRSNDGVVTITYMPSQASLAPVIPEILRDLPGCRELRCTVATTNVLWIQEEFRADAETLAQVNELARRWGAAVELLRYRPDEPEEAPCAPVPQAPVPAAKLAADGGVEDDVVEIVAASDRAFHDTLDTLVQAGRSGGGHAVAGSRERLLSAINPAIQYSLVLVGDVYLKKGSAARTRMTRELTQFLAEHARAPVIPAADLGAKLRFGPAQVAKLATTVVLTAALYALVFTHQDLLLDVLGGPFHNLHPWGAVLLVAVLAPLAAGLNAGVTSSVLRLLKLD
ncbi:MAG: cytidylate kinase-like family protein [Acidobacteria bacterium]|nr:MAG: cytidylate kinase-like family protein [Acidobacteriota bacterium]